MRFFGFKFSVIKSHRRIDWFKEGEELVLPITWQHDIPFVQCLVNNIQLNMMVDTGANINVLFESSLDKLGMPLIGDDAYTDGAKGQEPCIDLGGFDIHFGLGVSVSGAPFVSGNCPKNFDADGILSNSLFRDFQATLDFSRNDLRLRGTSKKVDRFEVHVN